MGLPEDVQIFLINRHPIVTIVVVLLKEVSSSNCT